MKDMIDCRNGLSLNHIIYRDNKFMKTKLFAFIVFITIVATGICIWISTDHSHNNDFTIPFALTVLFVPVFTILTELQIDKIAAATIIGVIIALIIKIIIDWQFDPTSHNLFPFEIVIDLFAISIASLIGAAIGFIYRKFIKGRFSNNK